MNLFLNTMTIFSFVAHRETFKRELTREPRD